MSEEEVKEVIHTTAVYPYGILAHAKSACFDGADGQSIVQRRRILV